MCILSIFQYTTVFTVEITGNTEGKEGEDSRINLEPQVDL